MDDARIHTGGDHGAATGPGPAAAAKPETSPAQARITKDRETQSRHLAQSVIRQLVESGYATGDLLGFVSEVLRAVNEHPGNDVGPQADAADAHNDRQAVPYRCHDGDGPAALRVAGPRVYLRPITPNDAQTLAGWLKDEAIRATFSERTLAEILGHVGALLRDTTRRDFLVCREDHRPIGMVCLHQIDREVRQAEMTKLLGDPEARGHGYAREATLLLLAYAFERLGLQRVCLQTAGFNMRNIRLNERIGFRYEGVRRRADRIAGRTVDVLLMGILASDFHRRYRVVPGD